MTNKINANADKLMDYLVVFDKKIGKVEELALSVSDLVKTAHTNISGNKNELAKVSDKVDQIKESVLSNTTKQEDLEVLVKRIMDEQIQASSNAVPGLLSGSKSVSIEDVMINQSCFSAAVPLGIPRQ